MCVSVVEAVPFSVFLCFLCSSRNLVVIFWATGAQCVLLLVCAVIAALLACHLFQHLSDLLALLDLPVVAWPKARRQVLWAVLFIFV